jgi:hypothetical protein
MFVRKLLPVRILIYIVLAPPSRATGVMLCQYCGDFSIASIQREHHAYQTSFEALKQSANEGCHLCTLFYESFNIDTFPPPSFGRHSLRDHDDGIVDRPLF